MYIIMNQKHIWVFSLVTDVILHMIVSLLDNVFGSTLKRCFTISIWSWFHSLNNICPSNTWNSLKSCLILSVQIGFKLSLINSDGENTMTGWHRGVVTLLENECNHLVLQTLCIPHLFDIVVKNVTQDVLDQAFYKVVNAYSIHLWMQQNLIIDFRSKFLKDTTCWVAFSSILHWFFQNYYRLMIHNAAKRTVQAPLGM